MSGARAVRFSRLGWILAAVLIVAAAVLLLLRQRGPEVDYALGGSLFEATADEIESVLLTRGGAQYRLERGGEGAWVLTGGVTDFVGEVPMQKLLDDLAAAEGGPLLPGTEPEDRRYDFYGDRALRLTVFTAGGGRRTLALGATNPVTGRVYASGAGRDACFPVSAALRERLALLPDSIRAKSLLPGFQFMDVDGIEITGRGAPVGLLRQDGHWWLHAPDGDYAALGRAVAEYQAAHADRRLEREDGAWVMADSDAVHNLLFEISETLVRNLVRPAEAAANEAAWGLDDPYRRVVLRGEGLNPDERYGPADRLSIEFGPSLDGDTAPARRLENVLLTDESALRGLEMPLSDLAFNRALDFSVLLADSAVIFYEGREILAGRRDPELFAGILDGKGGDIDRVEGRRAWLQERPVPQPALPGGPISHVRVRTLAVELERVPVLAVLPSAAAEPPLKAEQRCRVEVFAGGASRVVEFGWLDPGRLAGGIESVTPDQEGRRAAAWMPEDGRLLQVPAQILISIRNLRPSP